MNPIRDKILQEIMELIAKHQVGQLKGRMDMHKPKGLEIEKIEIMGDKKHGEPDGDEMPMMKEAGGEDDHDEMPGLKGMEKPEGDMSDEDLEELLRHYSR